MVIEVVNIRHKCNEWKKKSNDYLYIGRPSIFGNPFTHLTFLRQSKSYDVGDLIIVKSQQEAVDHFERWVYARRYHHFLEMKRKAILIELMSMTQRTVKLGCYCEPEPCHGHIIKRMLNDGFDISVGGRKFYRSGRKYP